MVEVTHAASERAARKSGVLGINPKPLATFLTVNFFAARHGGTQGQSDPP